MRNAFIFHGTEGYPEENWFPWLKAELDQRGLFSIVPQFPTPEGQTLPNWLRVLEPHFPLINKDTILIGHSLGGIFTLRVLEQLKIRVRAVFLVGTPIGVDEVKGFDLTREKLFLGAPLNWKKIRNSSDYFSVYHSDDDPYVSLDNGITLANQLGMNLNFMPNCGHFNAMAGFLQFPQLLNDILSLPKSEAAAVQQAL